MSKVNSKIKQTERKQKFWGGINFNSQSFCNVFAVIIIMCFTHAVFADFALMKDGMPTCSIVISKNASDAEKFASEELTSYLAKISGSPTKPAIGTEPVNDTYPVYLELSSDKRLDNEGFCLKADKNALRVQGTRTIGILYGVYEILKKYGGIRWLVPGPDGEYFKIKPTIEVPAQNSCHNPSSKIRMLSFVSANWNSPVVETANWIIRNNMRLKANYNLLIYPKLKEMYFKHAAVSVDGWHCYTNLLLGIGTKYNFSQTKKVVEQLFKKHPEYFPLINGKRVTHLHTRKGVDSYSAFAPQPCLSNSDVVTLMAENLAAYIKKVREPGMENFYMIINNDTTNWCECEKCGVTENPEERRDHQIPTKVWTFLNSLVAKTFKLMPDARLWCSAYQNFHGVPKGVKPDPRVSVLLAFNDMCYRHKLTDPNCPVNRHFLRLFKEWGKTGNAVATYEEAFSDFAGGSYAPVEKIYVDNLKEYHKIGIDGTMQEIFPLFGECGPLRKKWLQNVAWYADWQAVYLGAQFLWNINSDYDKIYAEINSLYYGKAWEAGMKDFRKVLTEAYVSEPGCYGYLHESPIGRSLTQPGLEKLLLSDLDKAEAAVKEDPRSLKHVQMDRKFFAYHWQRTHELYIKNFRDLRAYLKKDPIKIDGDIDEPDWRAAEVFSTYKTPENANAKVPTYFRAVYEPDYLYIAIEAMEPSPDKMKTPVKDPNGEVWKNNEVEVFLNYPDMGDKYYQFIISSEGIVWQKKVTPGNLFENFVSNAEIKTKIFKDRWITEMKIPTSELGMKCFTGQTWRMNSIRSRVMEGEPPSASSISGGSGANVQTFLPVSFVRERRGERDMRQWRNGNLDEIVKHKEPIKGYIVEDNCLPKHWVLNGGGQGPIKLAMKLHPSSKGNYYMQLDNCRVFQMCETTQSKFKVPFKAIGHGELGVYVNRYTPIPNSNGGCKYIANDGVKIFKIDSNEWKGLEYEYTKKDPKEWLGFVFFARKGEIGLDDIFVSPLDEGGK